MQTMTTADLPGDMTSIEAPAPVRVEVLTCKHGPACPACVLAAARLIVDLDATLVGEVRVRA